MSSSAKPVETGQLLNITVNGVPFNIRSAEGTEPIFIGINEHNPGVAKPSKPDVIPCWIASLYIVVIHWFSAMITTLVKYWWTITSFPVLLVSTVNATVQESAAQRRLTLKALESLMTELKTASSDLQSLMNEMKFDKARLDAEVEATVEMLEDLRDTKHNIQYSIRQLSHKIKKQDEDFNRRMAMYNTNVRDLVSILDEKVLAYQITMETLQREKGCDPPAAHCFYQDNEETVQTNLEQQSMVEEAEVFSMLVNGSDVHNDLGEDTGKRPESLLDGAEVFDMLFTSDYDLEQEEDGMEIDLGEEIGGAVKGADVVGFSGIETEAASPGSEIVANADKNRGVNAWGSDTIPIGDNITLEEDDI